MTTVLDVAKKRVKNSAMAQKILIDETYYYMQMALLAENILEEDGHPLTSQMMFSPRERALQNSIIMLREKAERENKTLI